MAHDGPAIVAGLDLSRPLELASHSVGTFLEYRIEFVPFSGFWDDWHCNSANAFLSGMNSWKRCRIRPDEGYLFFKNRNSAIDEEIP